MSSNITKTIKEIQFTAKKIEGMREILGEAENRLIKELVWWRKEKGMTQTALAQKFGITKSYLSDIEHGRRGVSKNILEKILELV